jgi:hypothetical protein
MGIEYQTYGWVWAKPRENEARFYWQHPHKEIAIHMSFNKDTQEFIGINTFGIRMRHPFFDTALTEKWSVAKVLTHLADANFDPEFYKLHEKAIVSSFNKQFKTDVVLKKKSWKRIFSTH